MFGRQRDSWSGAKISALFSQPSTSRSLVITPLQEASERLRTPAKKSGQSETSDKCACGNSDSKNSSSQESSSGNSNPSVRLRSRKCCLKESFKAIFINERFCDVHFIVGQEPHTERIPAHKLVLSVRSEVFDTMFDENWAANSTEIVVPDIEPAAFLALLRFLYTDDVVITPDTVIGILNAAKKYAVHALENKCVEFLLQNLCAENAFKILKEATLFDEPELVKSCLDVIDQNTSAAISADGFTDIDLGTLCSVLERDTLYVEEVELFEAVIRWSEAECLRRDLPINPENQQSVLGGALFSIRFPLMPPQDFSLKVAPAGLLSDKELVSLFRHFLENKEPSVNFNTKPRALGEYAIRKHFEKGWDGRKKVKLFSAENYLDDDEDEDTGEDVEVVTVNSIDDF